MQGWKEKLLSQAGKEIMIKAVVQSIPTYSMSFFWLPIGLLKDIKAMIRKFWWGALRTLERSVGLNRRLFVHQSRLEVWAFMTYACSMMPCWESKFGDYFMIGPRWFTRCFGLSILLLVIFLMR